MSSAILAFLSSVLYLFGLLVIVIPVSSVVTVLYVLLEPLQSCGLFPNWMQYLFRNFVQLPLRCARRIANPHGAHHQQSTTAAANQNHNRTQPTTEDPSLTTVRVETVTSAEPKGP